MLRERPTLTQRQELALLAWRDLCGERAVGMSLGPIPWRAIVAWCDRYRVTDAEEIIELVQCIDVEWLTDADKRPRPSANPPAAKGAR